LNACYMPHPSHPPPFHHPVFKTHTHTHSCFVTNLHLYS